MNQEIFIEGLGFVIIKRRRAQKTTSLRFSKEGKIVVGTNYSVPLYKIEKFVLENKTWIEDLKLKHGFNKNLEIFDGQILCPGIKFKLEYQDLEFDGAKFKYKKGSGEILIFTNSLEDSIKLNSEEKEELSLVVVKALRDVAKGYLPNRLDVLAKLMGSRYGKCTIRNSSSRWGSCSSNNDINLSLWLMVVPSRLIDYVLVHELAHTKFKNHKSEFWDEVSRYEPDYKNLRKKLKRYSTQVWW